MKYYPVFLDLRQRRCTVVGGGRVAERKVFSLLEAAADVTVVSPELTTGLRDLSRSGRISHLARKFEDDDIAGAFLVIAATDTVEVNDRIGKLCRKKQILVNVVAPPGESSFIVPSAGDRGDLIIAISTSGTSPALSRKLRRELEERYGPEYRLFLEKMAAVRNRLLEDVPDEAARRAVFDTLVESDVLELIRKNRLQEAERRMAEIVDGAVRRK